MAINDIRARCSINTNAETDKFVGIKYENGEYSIHFPLGFRVDDSDKGLRQDILLLLNTIAASTGKRESNIKSEVKEYADDGFPLQAYLGLIKDYYARGYYRIHETIYKVSNRGKINWNKTIKSQKPFVQKNRAFYLDFVVRNNNLSENELITQIHEYLVYDSFEKVGWLFTATMPKKPRIKYNSKLFKSLITDKLAYTFNDQDKKLFHNMLAIIDYKKDPNGKSEFRYGTNRFEYVWENLIDKVYGITGKDKFFPKTKWFIRKNNKKHDNAALEPDTIMIYGGNVYVLDAKYYKYGNSNLASDLPESTSINKQITYGEYIAEQMNLEKEGLGNATVYNAFLMPFDSERPDWKAGSNIINIGEAYSDWKGNDKSYERVQGILVDLKNIMKNCVRKDQAEIEKMAELITNAVRRAESNGR